MAAAAGQLVVGLDLGTSAVKGIAVDRVGSIVAEATHQVSVQTIRPGWSESDPEDWFGAAIAVLKQIAGSVSNGSDRIGGIATSGQMHGAVFLDSGGSVLRPAILWNDQRSDRESNRIAAQLGIPRLVSLVGNQSYPGFTAPKILWLREAEPEVYRRVDTVLLPKDYLNFRLTSVRATEPSDASGTLLFDVGQRSWSGEVLAACEIPSSFMPGVIPSTAEVGGLSADVAAQTGLPAGTPVIAGGADNACAALGLGIVEPGDTMVSIGTSGTVVAASARPHFDSEARLHTFCHVVPNVWYSMGVVLSAGSSLRWFRDTIWRNSRKEEDGYAEISEAAESAPLGAEGLIFLPYLSGERSPYGDADASGAFVGLTHRHDRAMMARAVMEGICFALRDSFELMSRIGIQTDDIRLCGGGARSAFWTQMIADVFDRQVWTVSGELGPAYGAALLAGAGTGLFDSPASAAQQFIEPRKAADPNTETVRRYQAGYEIYMAGYTSLAPMMHSLAASRRF